MSRTRILLADDNTAILEHESEILRQACEIVGKITDGDSVCAGVEKLRPDLIILDISMGEHCGIDICRELYERGYFGQVVFLTVHEDPDFVHAAFVAGGKGYVVKSRMAEDLERAVKAAMSHTIFVSPSLQQRFSAVSFTHEFAVDS